MVISTRKTSGELDKEAAKDAVRSFVNVQARDWARRQLNELWPDINAAIDAAVANGDAVDLPALMRTMWFDRLETK